MINGIKITHNDESLEITIFDKENEAKLLISYDQIHGKDLPVFDKLSKRFIKEYIIHFLTETFGKFDD